MNDPNAPNPIAAALAKTRLGALSPPRGLGKSAAACNGLPPSEPTRVRRPPRECGDLPFLIRRDGSWHYQGTPINRKELVCLFASVLRREADGSWWLQTPAERGRIEVEDAPFIAVELDWTGTGGTRPCPSGPTSTR